MEKRQTQIFLPSPYFIECDNELNKKKTIIKSNDIICPKCYKNARFNIKDYNININGCKNNHMINNILFDEFEKLQMIDISKIKCGDCRIKNKSDSYGYKFYYCLNCKMNLCVTCKLKHDKNHKIIDYDNKNYICNIHNEGYIRYCKKCELNMCLLCESKHNDHKTISIMLDLDKIKNNIKELRENIDIFNKNLENIVNKLNKVKKNFEIYYNIYNNIYLNYENKIRNYELFYNINEMNNNNNNLIKDIKKINNEININNKIKNILNIYNKMNNNEINIIYKIDDKKVKIFGSEFVKNNKKNCEIIYEDKEYELNEYFNIPNNIKDELKIKLRGINDIINMSCIFYECSSLLSIPDISKWNTSNIINMSYLFGKCEKIENIPDISNWNTSNVKYMQGIFMGCKSLKLLPDISKWDTSNVILMGGIFTNLSSLSPISFEEFMKYLLERKGKELIFGGMFSECRSLISLPDISKWNTNNVINMFCMFGGKRSGCSSLISLPDISKWNTNNVTNMDGMFYNCSSLISLPDISKWNTNNVTDMINMFYNCSSLISLPDISK